MCTHGRKRGQRADLLRKRPRFLQFFAALFVLTTALTYFLAQASSAYAAALTSVTDIPWFSDISTSSKHTTKFTTATTIPANGKMIVTFPAGFDVSGVTFDSWSGFDGGRSLSVLGQVVTIIRDNTGTSSTAGAKYIVLSGITNSATVATTYTVTVETQNGSSVTLDGPTASSSFSITSTNDGLDTSAPWPMRGHDNRQSFLSTAVAPDYPTLVWKFNFADNDYHSGAVEDSSGIVYIGGTSNVYALNSDGTTKWIVPQSHGAVAGTILTKDGKLVIWYRSGPIESRNINDGSLVWSYSAFGTDAGSLNIGPDGTIFISNNTLGIDAINSDGTRKFYNSAISGRDSTPAVDNTTGQIYTTDDGPATAINPDGTVKWNSGGPGSVGNPAQLNANGSAVCMEGRSGGHNTMCINTSDGSAMWYAYPASTGYGQGAFSPDDSIFYTMYNAASISARNATTGTANWTQAYAGGYGYAGGGNLMVDANNRVYAGQQAFNSNGTNRWKLLSVGSPIPIVGISSTIVYYDRSGNLYLYKPWTVSASANTADYTLGDTMTITAVSSMLRKDPSSPAEDNKIQAVMPNGDKVSLSYSSASGGNTTWTGTYTIPNTTTTGSYTGSVEAGQYQVQTDTATTFGSAPTGSSNTGITTTFSYFVDASAPVPQSFSPVSGSTLTVVTPTITFTTDETATCRVSLSDESYDDMSDAVTCNGAGTTSQSCTLPDLGSDGGKNIYVTCIDAVGNKDTMETNTLITYTLNSQAPTLTLTPLTSPTSTVSPPITGTATDTQGTITAVDYQVDSTTGIWLGCTANDGTFDSNTEAFTCVLNMSLADGAHTIYVRATDSDSNTTLAGAEVTVGVTVDTTAPVITSTQTDPATGQTFDKTFKPTSLNALNVVSDTHYPQFCFTRAFDEGAGVSHYSIVVDNQDYLTHIPYIQPPVGDNGDTRKEGEDVIKDTTTWRLAYHLYDDVTKQQEICAFGKSEDHYLETGVHSWSVKAVDQTGNSTTTNTNRFLVMTNQGTQTSADQSIWFPLTLSLVGNKTNLTTYSTTTPELFTIDTKPLKVSDTTPILFGITPVGAKVEAVIYQDKPDEAGITHRETVFTGSTTANATSEWGINIETPLPTGLLYLTLTATDSYDHFAIIKDIPLTVN